MMSAPARSSPSRPDPAFRSQYIANLYWVYLEFPQLPLSTENIFGMLDFDFRTVYAADTSPFLALHIAHRDTPPREYTEDWFLLNQNRILDALHVNTARQFFIENLVLLGILKHRFFVPIDVNDDNSDWIVCDIQPSTDAADKRMFIWYNEDFDNPRQKVSFMMLNGKNARFKGIKGFGAGLNFRVPYNRILSLSMRPCLFRDISLDDGDVDMTKLPSERLCATSDKYVVRDLYYPTLFRLQSRENRVLLRNYTYLSPLFVHSCMLSSHNFFIENVEARNFLSYFQNVHRYIKYEYERRLADNACDAEFFLKKFIDLILEIHKSK